MRRTLAVGAAGVLLAGLVTAGAIKTWNSDGAGGASPHFRAPNDASWSAKCVWSHQSEAVDPIVSYGVPVSAHMHQFLGEDGITSTTTPADLRTRATNFCPVSVSDPTNPTVQLVDNSAYWYPALYLTHDKAVAVRPAYGLFYYRSAGIDPDTVEPFPQDLAMVAGDSHAIGPQLDHVKFYCIAGANKTTLQPTIPLSCPMWNADPVPLPYQLKMSVTFPNCISPAAGPPNWTSGMTYAIDNPDPTSKWLYVCPDGYTPIPSVQFETRWSLAAFPSDGVNYDLFWATLASDTAESGWHGTTLHADFMSGWLDADLANLVTNCYHVAAINCGAFGKGPK